MDTIHQQVADLHQKIDYLIDQMAVLADDSQPPQASVLRPAISRKRDDSPGSRTGNPATEVGLNRFRALQSKQ